MYVERLDFIENHGVFALTDGQRQDLFQAIAELECGMTDHWAEYQMPDVAFLFWDDVVQIWLRRIAVSLRTDIDGAEDGWKLGWSLQEMDKKQLQTLLGLHYSTPWDVLTSQPIWPEGSPYGAEFEFGFDFLFSNYPYGAFAPDILGYVPHTLWCCDPSTVESFAKVARAYTLAHPGYAPDSQKDALCSLIDYMRRVLDWREPGHPGKSDILSHHNEVAGQSFFGGPNIEELFNIGVGGCHLAAPFIKEVLRSMNVPVAVGSTILYNEDETEEAEAEQSYSSGHSTILARLLEGEDNGRVDYTIWYGTDTIWRVPFRDSPASLVIMPMTPPIPSEDKYDYMYLVNWWWDEADLLGKDEVIKLFMRDFFTDWLNMSAIEDITITVGLFEGFFMPYAKEHTCPQSLAFMPGTYGEFPSIIYQYLNLPIVPGQNEESDLLMNDFTIKKNIEYLMGFFCDSDLADVMEGAYDWLDSATKDDEIDAQTQAIYELEKVMMAGAKDAYACAGACSFALGFGKCS